ncbi:hypothetical protein AKJ35_01345 [candidate division MSBL1 archaeon SCGC-AAA833F18]|uniref:DUF5615 domain-containing protein n=1 Tax=candidate division MSBL1 archaeon SCGC-AAA833F18 TaxID=1698257 RepID=A0A133VRR0_9EURY|nr:hypothetical protein AKJ35_01345 [candidate division MSBL1 archaeon SCGC-AAA833F18]
MLDEMYTGLKEYFQVLGWEVVTVTDVGLEGAEDKEVVQYAKENNLLLVTQDQKPGELAELMEVPHVLISKRAIAELIDSEIRKKYGEKLEE